MILSKEGMKKAKLIIIIFSFFCIICTSSFADIFMPLGEAVKEKKVKVEITGLGGSSGDTIQITVQRVVSEILHLTLDSGTVFLSKSGKVQNMVCSRIRGERTGPTKFRPRSEIVLRDNLKHAYIVESYCLDFHKANPGQDDQFEISTPDLRAKKILEAARNKSLNTATVQSAIWIDREGLSDKELKNRFPVSDTEIKAARDLLLQLKNKKKSQLKQKKTDLSKKAEPSKNDKQIQKSRLYVDTEPKDARVRILNIRPKYYNGIMLKPGKYLVEVSANGYKTEKIWVPVAAAEGKKINIRLKSSYYKDTKVTPTISGQAISLITSVTLQGELRRLYQDKLGLTDKHLSSEFASNQISQVMIDCFRLFNLRLINNEDGKKFHKIKIILGVELSRLATFKSLGIKGISSKGTAIFFDAAGNVQWRESLDCGFLGGVYFYKSHEDLWKKMLYRATYDIFTDFAKEDFLEVIKNEGFNPKASRDVFHIVQMAEKNMFDPKTRACIKFIGCLKDTRFVEPLRNFVDNNKFRCGLPIEAVMSLAKIGSKESINFLLNIFKEYPTDTEEHCKGVFFSWLLDALAKSNCQQDLLVSSLIQKYRNAKVADKYKIDILNTLGKIRIHKSKVFLEKISKKGFTKKIRKKAKEALLSE
jgi:hypothetical protein